MKCVLLVTLAVLPLIGQAEESPAQSELLDDSLRRLHQHDQGNWPAREAAAVFPDDSTLEGLALPGSHPIRPRNQHRRRRKRPRPQAPQEEAIHPVPRQPQQGYRISETPESDPVIETRNPEDHVIYESNFQQQKQQRPVEILPEETDQEVSEYKNNFMPKRPRGHKHEQEPEVADESFIPEPQAPSKSYRKPYSAKPDEESDEPSISPQNLKALLKQQSGSVSLSEILQQKNLSLADLLKGNRNALFALTSTQDQLHEEQEPPPARRLPSRSKYQNADNQRPIRYSENQQITVEVSTETILQRRLPPVKTPTRWKQTLNDNRKPLRFRDDDNVEIDTEERVKFVPSSPRRTSTSHQETSTTSSPETIEVTNSVIPPHFKEDPDANEEAEASEEVIVSTSTQRNDATPTPVTTTDNDIVVKQTNNQRSSVPLAVQETSVIDPVNILPEDEDNNQKRLRGKYLMRFRESLSQNSSKGEVTNRFRLPPPNLLQRHKTSSTKEPEQVSTQNNLVQEDGVSSTVKPQNVQPQRKEESSDTEVEVKIPLVPEIIKQGSEVKTDETGQDYKNIIGKSDVNTINRFKAQENHHHEDAPMYKVIPFSMETTTPKPNIPITTSARDEILEFLKTEMGSIRLARILASRNMTLTELIDHRERGSSQQHLAEIFKGTTVQPTQSNDSEQHKNDPNNNEDNEIMYQILKDFKHGASTNADIPTIQEMFGLLSDDHKLNHNNAHSTTESTSESSKEKKVDSNKLSESQGAETSTEDENILFDSLPNFTTQDPKQTPLNKHTTPSRKLHHTSTIYSFQPLNPYRPIITPRQTSTPKNEDIIDSTALLENFGQVRELNNKAKVNTYRDDERRFRIMFGDDLEDEITNNSSLPEDVKSAIVVSSAILGAAILGFLTIFVVCRCKQKRARKRFIDGIVNTKARSPILMQPEGKNSCGNLNPVMINSNDLYKRDLSFSGECHMNPGTRKYYLWRTIRKTLRYK